MGETEKISNILFELSNERRISILYELEKRNLKMKEISRSLDMTVTETFRHLQRLTDTKLVEKRVDGSYSISLLGGLALNLFTSFNFILNNSKYFLEHDIFSLPYEFVNRLGELSEGEFYGDPISNFNRVRKLVFDADEYIWAMSEQVESSHVQVTNEKVSQGLKFRFIMQKDLAKKIIEEWVNPDVEQFKERKYLDRIPVALLITEKESVVNFRGKNGDMDFIGYFGSDEKFHKWTRDLFMYYWERAMKWTPSTVIA